MYVKPFGDDKVTCANAVSILPTTFPFYKLSIHRPEDPVMSACAPFLPSLKNP